MKATLVRTCGVLVGFLLLLPLWGYAQTKVSGKIVDETTAEPLPFVNIFFKGTKVGTTSDINGQFQIQTSEPSDTLLVTYVGYKRFALAVKQNQVQQVVVRLKTADQVLQEVVINPGENPAHPILRKVIANKNKNDRDKLSAYQYETYNKIEFDINNINKALIESKTFKPIKFIFENIDSSNANEKPHLPLFLSETISQFYYKRQPKFQKEEIKASKITGVQNSSISQFMGDLYQKVNLYDNNILVFGKTFVSPISDNGLFYYRYYLIDSTTIDGLKCYQLKFKPKRKQELVFSGNMWIADSSFALKRIEMTIPNDANINYINTFNVIQEHTSVANAWMLSKDRLVVDFNLRDKKKGDMGFYGRKTTTYKNFVIDKPQADDFYSKTENLVVDEKALKRDDAYWDTARHEGLTKSEMQVYQMVDSIQKVPVFKTWRDVVMLIATGYYVKKNFEYGPYFNTVSYNAVEGLRLRLGGRTSNAFSNWYEPSAYIAYGFKDQEFKYKGGIRFFISKKPRQLAGFYYKKDIEVLGQSQNAFTNDNILSSLTRLQPLTEVVMARQTNMYYERDWITGFSTKISFVHRNTAPLGSVQYKRLISEGRYESVPNVITSEAKVNLRFAYGERYISGVFDRSSVGTKWPILQLNYTKGIKGVFESQYDYQRFTANVNDRFRINPLGYTDYVLEYGKVFGNLPFPLLEMHGGNETYVYDPYAYNLMNYFEFVSDEYATVQIFHHFDGFFFNKVPLIRKLKWREVLTVKALTGKVSQENKTNFLFPSTLSSLNKQPYVEVGAGIENIAKILRVDALWRLTYLQKSDAIPFGIRASMQFIF